MSTSKLIEKYLNNEFYTRKWWIRDSHNNLDNINFLIKFNF